MGIVQRLKEIAKQQNQILTLFLLSWEPESIICKPYICTLIIYLMWPCQLPMILYGKQSHQF